jgi:hypothetical protein
VVVGVRMIVIVRDGDTVIVRATAPIMRMLMGPGMSMSVCLMAGMSMIVAVRMLRNPLRMGMSARFTVLVTVRSGGAGVRHGGFLARFVV